MADPKPIHFLLVMLLSTTIGGLPRAHAENQTKSSARNPNIKNFTPGKYELTSGGHDECGEPTLEYDYAGDPTLEISTRHSVYVLPLKLEIKSDLPDEESCVFRSVNSVMETKGQTTITFTDNKLCSGKSVSTRVDKVVFRVGEIQLAVAKAYSEKSRADQSFSFSCVWKSK